MEFVILLLAVNFVLVDGHAYLADPPFRAKKAGHTTPQGWNCGGLQTQWGKYHGKCGVCGDEFGVKQENMVGGRWFPGVVTGTYIQGQNIDVTIRVTANHKGTFNFSLCVNNDFTKPVTEKCLAKHTLVITDPSSPGKKYTNWPLPGDVRGDKVLGLKLPDDVYCEQCILRWFWEGGNNWGNSPQECFVNCADIEIKPSGEPKPVTVKPQPTTTTKNTKTTADPNNAPWVDDMYITEDNGKRCTSKDPMPSPLNADQWCGTICSKSNFCPESHCIC